VVTGGTFNRGNDSSYPATVSDFRLDNYEITVGRFRKFWSGYPGNRPARKSGRNPNNPSDTGWDSTWNDRLPATQAELTDKISCSPVYELAPHQPSYQTWTMGDDALPMNCVDWYEAEAFCIWDGGRLPTEAEWNYAAAGGAAQRLYPWGDAPPDCTFANFLGAAAGTDYCVVPGTGAANRVGSESPKGDGLYGQADLAGNLFEWAQDSPGNEHGAQGILYIDPCTNCVDTTDPSFRVLRSGDLESTEARLRTTSRFYQVASDHSFNFGARCARAR
jgi:formylglycine-generating enzyme required for sulfatase activity